MRIKASVFMHYQYSRQFSGKCAAELNNANLAVTAGEGYSTYFAEIRDHPILSAALVQILDLMPQVNLLQSGRAQ